MCGNHFLLNLCIILACFLSVTVVYAHEAIVGGLIVLHRQLLPYQAAIRINHLRPNCGAGLIKHQFVLTAASCVIANNGEVIDTNIIVVAGTIDLANPGITAEVDKIFVPNEYYYALGESHHTGDIAILQLKRTIDFQRNTNLVMLKLPDYKKHITFENKRVKIAGFGWDIINPNNTAIGGSSDQRIRVAEAVVMNHTECHHEHPYLPYSSEKHLCAKVNQGSAGVDRHGVCYGDTGGPLVQNGQIVIGVLTIPTVGCAELYSSAVYTSTKYYRRFIHNAMNNVTKGISIQYRITSL